MIKPFLSVIIPAYNEAERLPLTLVDMDRILKTAKYSYEIIVVNDGSTDNTADIVRKMSETIKNLKLIDNKVNQGKGAMVRQGMLLAKGQYRLFTDTNNFISIDHFDKMIPYFSVEDTSQPDGEKGYHVVIGSYTARENKLESASLFYKQLFEKGNNIIIQIVNFPRIFNTHCGFKAFSEEAAEKIFSKAKINGSRFDIEALALARRLNYRIKEISVKSNKKRLLQVKPSAYLLKMFSEYIKIHWWIATDAYGIRGKERIANSK